jgi:hypothetical protein
MTAGTHTQSQLIGLRQGPCSCAAVFAGALDGLALPRIFAEKPDLQAGQRLLRESEVWIPRHSSCGSSWAMSPVSWAHATARSEPIPTRCVIRPPMTGSFAVRSSSKSKEFPSNRLIEFLIRSATYI